MTANTKERHPTQLGEIFILAGIFIMLAAPCILGFQCLKWLRYGSWPELSGSDALKYFDVPAPVLDWVGIQKIIDWFASCPLSGWLFFTGMLVAYIGVQITELQKK